MAQLITTDYRRALIGIGVSGFSVARYLSKTNKEFDLFDTRQAPTGLSSFQEEFDSVSITLGEIDPESLVGYREIILSPGIDPNSAWLMKAREAGADIIGDIELFARVAKAPIVSITGSNAKSTVTTLVGKMAKCAGLNVAVGGNLGIAALDLLADDIDLYVLELSSFQLEIVHNLSSKVACILNISADHMDRYPSMVEYHAAKQRIYKGAEHIVVNYSDVLTHALMQTGQTASSFCYDEPDLSQYGLRLYGKTTYLVKGREKLISADELKIKGKHNQVNVLSALAIGEAINLPFDAMKQASIEFEGLEHRSQTVAEKDGILWVNDSKATNVGATSAALSGLGAGKNIVLIAGGQAKGQSFSELAPLVSRHVSQLILIGEDADKLQTDLAKTVPSVVAVDLKAAVKTAADIADSGNIVLLSPACASFDMFTGYEQRGQMFTDYARSINDGGAL